MANYSTQTNQTTIEPSLALYIHIPWCIKKCPYCDFNSHTTNQNLRDIEQQYLSCLIDDFTQDLMHFNIKPNIHSIFIGGGTPSLLSGSFYKQLLNELQHHAVFTKNIEITMEANPGTVDLYYLEGYLKAGINRLSFGIQSTNDHSLQKLGRIHNAADALNAVTTAKNIGFTNINCDIMFGLPNQQLQDAMIDIERVMKLEPTHFSWYQLTIEPNTYFYKYTPTLPNEDHLIDMQIAGQKLIKAHGFNQYEVSAYHKDSKNIHYQSNHNRTYWEFGDYLAIGAGAHGKITQQHNQQRIDPDQKIITRFQKTRLPEHYLNKKKQIHTTSKHNNKYTSDVTTLVLSEVPIEYMLNKLRLKEFHSYKHFTQQTGLSIDYILPTLKYAENIGLIKCTNKGFDVLELGWNYLNDLIYLFNDNLEK